MPRLLDQDKINYAKTLLSQNLSIQKVREELKKIFGTSISPNKLIEYKRDMTEQSSQIIKSKPTPLKGIFGQKKLSYETADLYNTLIAPLQAKLEQQSILIYNLWEKIDQYDKTISFWDQMIKKTRLLERVKPAQVSDSEFLLHRKEKIAQFLSLQESLPDVQDIAMVTKIDRRIVEILLQELGELFEPIQSKNLAVGFNLGDSIEVFNHSYNPSEVEGSKKLTLTNLGITNLTEIRGLDKIEGIQLLDISENKLIDVDFSFLRNTPISKSLNRLVMRYNQIENIMALDIFDEINSIYVSGNELTSISNWDFRKLKKISTIDISDNFITDISGIELCESLTFLDASNNEISSIDLIGNITKISTLFLSGNRINSLPEKLFSELTQLFSLDLSNNDICDIATLKWGQSLVNVNLSKNRINFLPNLQCQSLETLDISYNEIDELPSFEKCKNLTEIIISGNPLISIEESKKNVFPKILISEDDIMEKKEFLDIQDSNINIEENETAQLNPTNIEEMNSIPEKKENDPKKKKAKNKLNDEDNNEEIEEEPEKKEENDSEDLNPDLDPTNFDPRYI